MSNRRVKNIGYDDDDDLDYNDNFEEEYNEGDDELSPEDKEQLRLGTIEVKTILGPGYNVSDTEIQDSLWNFYYDITKTVAYIKGKQKPKTGPSKTSQVQYHHSISAKSFFSDCPWGQIPEDRKAEILISPSSHPRGLLGGASKDGKMSKLAALAAKRRQKETTTPGSTCTPAQQGLQDEYAASLSKLSLGSEKPRDRMASKQGDIDVKMEDATANMPDSEQSQKLLTQQSMKTPKGEPVVDRIQPSAFADTLLDGTTYGQNFSVEPKFLNTGQSTFDFSGPSPDDIVYLAQTGRTPKNTTPIKQPNKTPQKGNTRNAVENLTITETPKIKSKNIDVVSEYNKVRHKNAASFVVIGHVDAGKSTLMGRLLFDLKAVDQRTMEKYQKEADNIGKGSFAFAWVLDQGTEERARGVTIDIATNNFETETTSFTILDAPGHQDFVPNMIAGTSQADFAVLVIDASPGNFESGLRGQTREHALLAKSIGVQRMIVAINKMDTVSWSQERFENIKQQMSTFLKATRFNLESTAFIPCSGLQGSNILRAVTDQVASWYKGETLVQALDAYEPTTHNIDRPLRMTIADVFRGGVQNPLSISGRIEAGHVQVGEQILVLPSNETATVKGLDVESDTNDKDNGDESAAPLEYAVAGQAPILHLSGIDPVHLSPGSIICHAGAHALQNTGSFTAQILSFAHLTPMNVDVHRGRMHVAGRIEKMVAVLDKRTGEVVKKRPRVVKPEEVVRLVIKFDDGRGVPMEAGWRVILRAGGETVGAGVVE